MKNGWLRRPLVTIGALAFALALAACIVRPGPGGDPQNPSSGGDAAIVVRNTGGEAICVVQFSSTSSSEWGGDQLGSSETIAPGDSRSFAVNAGSYDVRGLNCDQQLLGERRGVSVSGSTDVSLP